MTELDELLIGAVITWERYDNGRVTSWIFSPGYGHKQTITLSELLSDKDRKIISINITNCALGRMLKNR